MREITHEPDPDETPSSLCQKHGWAFQEPYTLSLELVVTRRRKGCNPTQLKFWMSEATPEQKSEAMVDALAIMNLK